MSAIDEDFDAVKVAVAGAIAELRVAVAIKCSCEIAEVRWSDDGLRRLAELVDCCLRPEIIDEESDIWSLGVNFDFSTGAGNQQVRLFVSQFKHDFGSIDRNICIQQLQEMCTSTANEIQGNGWNAIEAIKEELVTSSPEQAKIGDLPIDVRKSLGLLEEDIAEQITTVAINSLKVCELINAAT